MIGRLKSKVNSSTVDSILEQGLHEFLNDVKKELYEIGIALNQNYFCLFIIVIIVIILM